MIKQITCIVAVLIVYVTASYRHEVGWRDPSVQRSIKVEGNYTGQLQAGDVIEMICMSENVNAVSTHSWHRAEGPAEFGMFVRGYNNLSLTLTVTPDHNGQEFYCMAPFSEQPSNTWEVYSYYVYSPRIRLEVAGGPTTTFPQHAGYLQMRTDVDTTTHRVGDTVWFSCSTVDIWATVVSLYQVKTTPDTTISMPIHTGWQPSRSLGFNITASDDATEVFCTVSTLLPGTLSTVTYVSNSVPIYVEN